MVARTTKAKTTTRARPKGPAMTPQQVKAEALRQEINATLKGDVMQMASDQRYVTKYLPTSLLPIDCALPGGLPRGRMTEFFGGPSSLKSYIGYCSIAEAQRNGQSTALIDMEHSFDADWAEHIGIDLKSLVLTQCDTGEEALDASEAFLRMGGDLMVFDSVAAALPQTEANSRLYENKTQPGRHAMMFSKGLRKLTASNTDTAVMFINQTRLNIGVTFGSPEVTPGGKALPFYASIRARLQHTGKVTEGVKVFDGEKYVEGKVQTAQKFKLTLEKSKLSRPFAEMHFIWSLQNGGALDLPAFVMGQGQELGIITLKGNTWHALGTKTVGREAFKTKLATDDALFDGLIGEVREHYDLPTLTPTKPQLQAHKPLALPGKSAGPTRQLVRRKMKAG